MGKKNLQVMALLAITCLYNEALNAAACTQEQEKTCRDLKEMCDQKSEKSLLACQKIKSLKNQNKQAECFVALNKEKRDCYEKCSCEKMCTAKCNADNKSSLSLCEKMQKNTSEKGIQAKVQCFNKHNEKIAPCKKECLGK